MFGDLLKGVGLRVQDGGPRTCRFVVHLGCRARGVGLRA